MSEEPFDLNATSEIELLEDIQPSLISTSDSLSISQVGRQSDVLTSSEISPGSEDAGECDKNENTTHMKEVMIKERSSSLQDLPSLFQSGHGRLALRLVSSGSKDSGLPLSSSCASLCSGVKPSSDISDRRWSLESNSVRNVSVDILSRELEEKQIMLEMLQQKYNELLVLYADSKNTIDRLRCHSYVSETKPMVSGSDLKKQSVCSQPTSEDIISVRRFSTRLSCGTFPSVSSSTESSLSKVKRWQESWSSNSGEDDDSVPQCSVSVHDDEDARSRSDVTSPTRVLHTDNHQVPPVTRTVQPLSDSNEDKKRILLFLSKAEACAKHLHAESEKMKSRIASLHSNCM